jgi:hypothetical protein
MTDKFDQALFLSRVKENVVPSSDANLEYVVALYDAMSELARNGQEDLVAHFMHSLATTKLRVFIGGDTQVGANGDHDNFEDESLVGRCAKSPSVALNVVDGKQEGAIFLAADLRNEQITDIAQRMLTLYTVNFSRLPVKPVTFQTGPAEGGPKVA